MRALVPHKEKVTQCHECIEHKILLDNIKMCGIFKIVLDIFLKHVYIKCIDDVLDIHYQK